MTQQIMYRVRYFEGASPLICKDFKELVDELITLLNQLNQDEGEPDVRIETISMSPEELAALPEFEGP